MTTLDRRLTAAANTLNNCAQAVDNDGGDCLISSAIRTEAEELIKVAVAIRNLTNDEAGL